MKFKEFQASTLVGGLLADCRPGASPGALGLPWASGEAYEDAALAMNLHLVLGHRNNSQGILTNSYELLRIQWNSLEGIGVRNNSYAFM